MTAITAAWKMNAARQLIPVVMTPPINGPPRRRCRPIR
jgi:hypothetical protein